MGNFFRHHLCSLIQNKVIHITNTLETSKPYQFYSYRQEEKLHVVLTVSQLCFFSLWDSYMETFTQKWHFWTGIKEVCNDFSSDFPSSFGFKFFFLLGIVAHAYNTSPWNPIQKYFHVFKTSLVYTVGLCLKNFPLVNYPIQRYQY